MIPAKSRNPFFRDFHEKLHRSVSRNSFHASAAVDRASIRTRYVGPCFIRRFAGKGGTLLSPVSKSHVEPSAAKAQSFRIVRPQLGSRVPPNACRGERRVVWGRAAPANRFVLLQAYSFQGSNTKANCADDVLIVAQVSDLLNRLPPNALVGTVDRFQGQQAPVVIYSMTTASPEDAPRGMEFSFQPEPAQCRNVARSRLGHRQPPSSGAECRSPRQMQLANALCLEMAQVVETPSYTRSPLLPYNSFTAIRFSTADAFQTGVE